tara:strand:- start:132 stop:485 length:354 start_codon:yes stop_codon:yes gene_type:complete
MVMLMATSAHLLLRAGMLQVGRVGTDELRDPIRVAFSMLSNPKVLGAAPLYAGSFVGWTVALSRVQLSLAFPLLAMTYVFVPVASWAVLHESVTAMHWGGMAIIVIGVLVVLRAGTS